MTEIHRMGLTLLSAGDSASRDQHALNIIFIHGLRGHPRTTWSHLRSTPTSDRGEDTDGRIEEHKNIKSFFRLSKSKKEKNNQGQTSTSISADIFWPEEYLVPDLPQARIWTYGYNADVIGGIFQANNKSSVSQHGRTLAAQLDREIDNHDPIIFVVHSLGGIIVKDALHRSDKICKRTRLIIFLGTPHRGSTYAGWGEIASNLASIGLQDSNKRLVQTLEVNDEVLDNIHEEFKTILAKCAIKVHSFQEAKGISGMRGLSSKVVDDFSSKLDLAREQETVETIDANHMEMARCSSRDDARYRQIHGVLKQFISTELVNRETSLANTADRSCPVGFSQPPPVTTVPPMQINVPPRAMPKESPSETTLPADTENSPSSGSNASGWTILHAAVNSKSVKGVRLALSKGADPNCETDDKRFTPLWVAACHGLLEITHILLDAGANVNAVNFEGTTPLKEAAQIGATEVVRLLIERGANLDQAPYLLKDGPLIVAAAKGHIEVVRLLLTAGANSQAQQSGGWSCLHYSLFNKNKEMTALVLEYCPDVNASDRGGLRPLHLASLVGFADICSQLVNLGAEVEARDKGGLTALRVGVQAGELKVVKILIERGARTDTVGEKDGFSLTEVALILGHESVYRYLEEQTAL